MDSTPVETALDEIFSANPLEARPAPAALVQKHEKPVNMRRKRQNPPRKDIKKPPHVDKFISELQNEFIQHVCKLDELKEALAKEPGAKAQQFLAALVDPKYKNWTFPQIAAKCNVSNVMLEQIWRSHALSKQMATLIGGSPKVAEDTVEDAKSTWASCPRCDGWGTISREPPKQERQSKGNRHIQNSELYNKLCPNCEGKGSVRVSGNTEARKIVFRATGLLTDKPAVVVNNNVMSLESIVGEIERVSPRAGSIEASYEETPE